MTETEAILAECKRTLAWNRAVGTGIGVFGVITRESSVLLRRRLEKDSLYHQDLSGRWEMTGGGVDLSHFTAQLDPESYQQAIFMCLSQELEEEAGLKLISLPQPLSLIPAWLWRPYEDKETKEQRIIIDLAFSIPLKWEDGHVQATKEFEEKIKKGEIMFIPIEKLGEIDIISQRTRFLIEEALKVE